MEIIRKIVSKDNTAIKYLQKLKDDFVVETTYVNYRNKHIICFSSQVGCAIGCKFCASGLFKNKRRYHRSLRVDEIVEQCKKIVIDRDLFSGNKPILFSCMGEGEPFLNYFNLVDSFKILENDYSSSLLAVSTSGIKPDLIRSLAHIYFSIPLKLQISLHGSNDKTRKILIPNVKPILEIVGAVKYYQNQCGRPVDWNYILFEGINDSTECAIELANLLGPENHVKFNTFNKIDGSPLRSSSEERVFEFEEVLKIRGLTTECYETNGTDIMAACGQLKYSHSIRGD